MCGAPCGHAATVTPPWAPPAEWRWAPHWGGRLPQRGRGRGAAARPARRGGVAVGCAASPLAPAEVRRARANPRCCRLCKRRAGYGRPGARGRRRRRRHRHRCLGGGTVAAGFRGGDGWKGHPLTTSVATLHAQRRGGKSLRWGAQLDFVCPLLTPVRSLPRRPWHGGWARGYHLQCSARNVSLLKAGAVGGHTVCLLGRDVANGEAGRSLTLSLPPLSAR